MLWRRSAGKPALKRTLLAAPILALGFAIPAAAQAENYTVFIGSPGNDIINEAGQAGNFHLWGLGGFNALAGGQGDNELVGNGSCPANLYNTKGYDNASEQWDSYCNTGQLSGSTGAVLVGGGGVNTIIGSGGVNIIASGPDHPSSGTGNYIYGGPVGDVIAAVAGSSTIYEGLGHNLIDARGPYVDYIYCTKGDKNTTVYAEKYDVIQYCAHVIYGNPGQAPALDPPLKTSSISAGQALVAADSVSTVNAKVRRVHGSTKAAKHAKHARRHAKKHARHRITR
jgi:hypothetical protein